MFSQNLGYKCTKLAFFIGWPGLVLEIGEELCQPGGAQSIAVAPLHQKESVEVVYMIKKPPKLLPLEVYCVGSPKEDQ